MLAVLVACGARTQLDDDASSSDADTPDLVETSVDVVLADVAGEEVTAPPAQCDVTTPTVLATSSTFASQVALDDSFAYFAQYTSIERVSKAGGASQLIASAWLVSSPVVAGFALDATDLYYVAEMYHVDRLPKGGGTEQELFDLYSEVPLTVVNGPHLYVWSGDGGTTLFRIPTAGGASTVVTSQLPAYTNAIAIDGNVAYVTSNATGTWVVDLTNGSALQRDTMPAWNVVIDSTYAYFTTGNHDPKGPNAVMRMAKTGGAPEELAKATYAFALALDGDSVYFTDTNAGAIERVPKGGGVPTTVATDGDDPIGIAVDDRCVYWTNAHGLVATPK
jgi:hypothetical protein